MRTTARGSRTRPEFAGDLAGLTGLVQAAHLQHGAFVKAGPAASQRHASGGLTTSRIDLQDFERIQTRVQPLPFGR